jgi:hypothetical protein
VGVVSSILGYAVYFSFYFASPEYTASSTLWNLTAYELTTQEMIKDQPYANFDRLATGTARFALSFPRKVFMVNTTDASVVPNIAQGLHAKGILVIVIFERGLDGSTAGAGPSASCI